jgi:hypothetical protein
MLTGEQNRTRGVEAGGVRHVTAAEVHGYVPHVCGIDSKELGRKSDHLVVVVEASRLVGL